MRALPRAASLDLEDLKANLNERTKLVSLVRVSNTLGCLNPIEAVAALGADSLVGSSHKLCGPRGMGFLCAHEALLEAMPPFLGMAR